MAVALLPSSLANFCAFARVLSARMMFSPPEARLLANLEPMFPVPMIAVFMVDSYLLLVQPLVSAPTTAQFMSTQTPTAKEYSTAGCLNRWQGRECDFQNPHRRF